MKTVTYEQVIAMNPSWLETKNGGQRLKRYAERLGGKATALDILGLKRVPADDRLTLVLREDFIDAPILCDFAKRCTDRATQKAWKPTIRSWMATKYKRELLTGKITKVQLADMQDDVWDEIWDNGWAFSQAAALTPAQATACEASWAAAWTIAQAAAQNADHGAAWSAAQEAAWDEAWENECAWQIAELAKMLNEAEQNNAYN